ncbi:MAG: hypothetical protein HY913_04215 [Desulfomonile tiedjei]|nr:hypothetical protein [Desulfomonile tiedjei]
MGSLRDLRDRNRETKSILKELSEDARQVIMALSYSGYVLENTAQGWAVMPPEPRNSLMVPLARAKLSTISQVRKLRLLRIANAEEAGRKETFVLTPLGQEIAEVLGLPGRCANLLEDLKNDSEEIQRDSATKLHDLLSKSGLKREDLRPLFKWDEDYFDWLCERYQKRIEYENATRQNI